MLEKRQKKKTEHLNVVLLNICIYISTVNQMLVCDVESLCTSQIIYVSEVPVNIIK